MNQPGYTCRLDDVQDDACICHTDTHGGMRVESRGICIYESRKMSLTPRLKQSSRQYFKIQAL